MRGPAFEIKMLGLLTARLNVMFTRHLIGLPLI